MGWARTAWKLLLPATLGAALAAGSWRSELESLVKAERDFAAASLAAGTRNAFLAFIAEDGVLFRPGPVPGKKWLLEHAATPGTLNWYPVYADVSAAGDLGYTTGPYEFSGDQGTRNGHYVTVWRRQPGGAWRFVADCGISHPRMDPPPAEDFPSRPAAQPGANLNPAREASALLEAEDEFEAAAARQGLATAYAGVSTADIRIYRDGRAPTRGRRAMLDLFKDKPGIMTWKPAHADVSRSCDLGFTYGTFEFRPDGSGSKPLSGSYLRTWKRSSHDSWKLALDIVN